MQEEEGIKYAYLTYENQQYQQNAVKKKNCIIKKYRRC